MSEDTDTNGVVHVGVRMQESEVAEIRTACELLRAKTGRRVTQSDVVREGALRHARAVVARERRVSESTERAA